MNVQQTLSTVRSSLIAVGAVAVALGWINPVDVPPGIDAVVGLVGAVSTSITVLWGIWEKTHAKQIANAVAVVQSNPTLANVAPLAGALRDAGAQVSLPKVLVTANPKEA